ncbi:hypothetical protein [Actinokineospora sp. UTMC 2448]|uniref:hypothetical protein n=1 Tax=Actinokineospora sp. UTMC 2448 TaxID=2268449 RepID=UPI0021645DB5|nr:hypothetical protein [Actinokineospora sp. UTMC 2448]UVS81838.1 hypothetical protein Actkin_05602 [Actinokineospora sp. UTMC 2448]
MSRASQIERIIAKGQLVPLVFMQDAVAASQTDAQLLVAEVASAAANSVDGYVMPFEGEVVAVTARLSAAATAGSLTVGATVGGTEETSPALSITTEQSASETTLRGTATFSAGDVIGAEITTDASWDATTADLVVVVWVLLHLDGI